MIKNALTYWIKAIWLNNCWASQQLSKICVAFHLKRKRWKVMLLHKIHVEYCIVTVFDSTCLALQTSKLDPTQRTLLKQSLTLLERPFSIFSSSLIKRKTSSILTTPSIRNSCYDEAKCLNKFLFMQQSYATITTVSY